ncbi:MAG: hypothetical protein CMK92_04805 [Pseudomonas sp.]|nr:hypothetical protein [Pseudomonas sp.]
MKRISKEFGCKVQIEGDPAVIKRKAPAPKRTKAQTKYPVSPQKDFGSGWLRLNDDTRHNFEMTIWPPMAIHVHKGAYRAVMTSARLHIAIPDKDCEEYKLFCWLRKILGKYVCVIVSEVHSTRLGINSGDHGNNAIISNWSDYADYTESVGWTPAKSKEVMIAFTDGSFVPNGVLAKGTKIASKPGRDRDEFKKSGTTGKSVPAGTAGFGCVITCGGVGGPRLIYGNVPEFGGFSPTNNRGEGIAILAAFLFMIELREDFLAAKKKLAPITSGEISAESAEGTQLLAVVASNLGVAPGQIKQRFNETPNTAIIVTDSNFWIKMLSDYIPSWRASGVSLDSKANSDIVRVMIETLDKMDSLNLTWQTQHVSSHNKKGSLNKFPTPEYVYAFYNEYADMCADLGRDMS